MSEHREALDKIITQCMGSSTNNRRNSAIMEIAMVALGFTKNQRDDMHKKLEEKTTWYNHERKLKIQESIEEKRIKKARKVVETEEFDDVVFLQNFMNALDR